MILHINRPTPTHARHLARARRTVGMGYKYTSSISPVGKFGYWDRIIVIKEGLKRFQMRILFKKTLFCFSEVFNGAKNFAMVSRWPNLCQRVVKLYPPIQSHITLWSLVSIFTCSKHYTFYAVCMNIIINVLWQYIYIYIYIYYATRL